MVSYSVSILAFISRGSIFPLLRIIKISSSRSQAHPVRLDSDCHTGFRDGMARNILYLEIRQRAGSSSVTPSYFILVW